MKGLVKRMLRQWGYDVVPWRDGWLTERDSPSAPVPLRDEHVRNCRVLANRQLLVAQLPKRGVVAELGVGLGDFSAVILEQAVPRQFHAIDLFGWHDRPTVWGLPTKDVLGGRSHEEFYRAGSSGRSTTESCEWSAGRAGKRSRDVPRIRST